MVAFKSTELMLSTYSQVLRIIEKEKVENKSKKKQNQKAERKTAWIRSAETKQKKKQTKVQKQSK